MALLFRILDESREPRLALQQEANEVRLLESRTDAYTLFRKGLGLGMAPLELVERSLGDERLPLDMLVEQRRLLLPIAHPDPAHCLVTGTGLTHLGSAEIRDRMAGDALASDSYRLFIQGKEGGRPGGAEIGVRPEWFFKGLGDCLVGPYENVKAMGFNRSFGEEPEIAGVYMIDADRRPIRLGYVLTSDYSDHEEEQENYLYVASSKLQYCGVAPALFLGDLPAKVDGKVEINRKGTTVWSDSFHTGEARMTHSFANLEHHHFKHDTLVRPGDLHIHLFGCPSFSFGSGVRLESEDEVRISAECFGPAMHQRIRRPAGDVRRIDVREFGSL